MLRSFSEKIFPTKIGKTKITQRLTSFLISCLCLERVVELSLFSFVNLDSIILLWIVFLIRQMIGLCLLKFSSKIWVFTSFGSFLSQIGRRADKSHQLATNAARPAKPADKFNQSRLHIKYLGCIPQLIKNQMWNKRSSETKSQLLFEEGKPPKKRPFKGTLCLNLLKSAYSA